MNCGSAKEGPLYLDHRGVATQGLSQFHDYDLSALGMPPVAWPLALGRGKHNYTIKGPTHGAPDGSVVDVQLRERKFYIKKVSNGRKLEVSPSVAFRGDVASAWVRAVELSGWDDPLTA